MSPAAAALILVAALAHATWNLLSKQAAATAAACFTWLLAACASCLYAPVIVVSVLLQPPHLAELSWLFMAGTGLLQTGYFLFLQAGYRIGDLSLVYPVGRGTGALLAALAGIAVLGEHPGPVGLAGILLVVGGIVAIGLPAARPVRGARRPAPLAAIGFALGTGAFIAGYTLWDKYAVSSLHTPALLQGCAAFPVMLAALAPMALSDRPRLTAVWRSFRPQIVAAAALAPLAYVLVLAALSFTAVSVVAPAREISVLFGVVLGGRLLDEGSLARRLAAGSVIVVGIVALAVG